MIIVNHEQFYIMEVSTGSRTGPFRRVLTYKTAMAMHAETGHILVIFPVDGEESVACVMDGQWLDEMRHDDEGRSLPPEPFLPEDTEL